MDIIKYNFIAYIAVFSMLILTLTGWDRFIPKFALPREPKVRLKTKEEIAADEAALRVQAYIYEKTILFFIKKDFILTLMFKSGIKSYG